MAAGGNFKGNQGNGGWKPPAGMPGGIPQYAQPGFASGGPNDPAMGGSGYMGGLGTGTTEGWAGPGGGNVQNPGMTQYPLRPPTVQNPGMPGGGKYPRYPGMGGTGPDEGWAGTIAPPPPGMGVGYGNQPGYPPGFQAQNPPEGELGTGPDQGWVPGNPRGFSNADRGSNFRQAAGWANKGKYGKAKQAIESGGGTWGKDMHRFLKNRPRKMVINN